MGSPLNSNVPEGRSVKVVSQIKRTKAKFTAVGTFLGIFVNKKVGI